MKRFLKLFFKESVRAVAVPLFLFGALAALAFTEPSVGPTGGTVYAPVNTGGTAQTKSGNFTSSGTVTGNVVNGTSQMCLAGSCISAWPAGGGTVTSVSAGTGMSFPTITTSGSVSLNTSGISSCTDSINSKIYWNGSQLVCGADQNSGGGGGYWAILGSNIYNTNSGYVGIGTGSPSEKLHVNGSIYVGSNWYKAGNITSVNNAISLWSAEGGVISGFNSGRAVGMGQTTSGYPGFGISSGATALAAFYHDPFSNETVVEAYGARNIRFATNGATRMTVNSSGYVGIGSGMSSPWAQLDLGGGVGQNSPAFRAMDNSFSRYIMIVPYLGTGGFSNVSQSGDSGLFSAQGTGLVLSPWNAPGIRIAPSSGYVGIGTGNPGYRLDVAGDINLTGCARNGATVYAGICVSDARLKKNIEPLSGSLAKITALNPVSFEFNDSQYGAGPQEGLIAQEVEKIFPDWVITGEDGYKRIKYGIELQLRLIGAIKEQQKEIDSLKARLDALEKK